MKTRQQIVAMSCLAGLCVAMAGSQAAAQLQGGVVSGRTQGLATVDQPEWLPIRPARPVELALVDFEKQMLLVEADVRYRDAEGVTGVAVQGTDGLYWIEDAGEKITLFVRRGGDPTLEVEIALPARPASHAGLIEATGVSISRPGETGAASPAAAPSASSPLRVLVELDAEPVSARVLDDWEVLATPSSMSAPAELSATLMRLQFPVVAGPGGGDPACGPGAGSCFLSNGTPGCDDVDCCNAVCNLDPFCCDTEWDANCVGPNAFNPGASALDLCIIPTAACCFGDTSCQDLTPDDCDLAGGIFQGFETDCMSTTCQALPCSEPPEHCQPGDPTNADNSDQTNFIAADDFNLPAGGAMTSICWWGAYSTGVPTPDTFTVTYYDDAGGFPGAVVGGPFSGGALTVLGPVDTGEIIAGAVPEYEYTGTHAPVNLGPGCYWVSIVNPNDGTQAWFWEFGTAGNGQAVQDGPGPDGFDAGDTIFNDLKWCLDTAVGDPSDCATGPTGNDNCVDCEPIAGEGVFAFDNSAATSVGPDHADCDFFGQTGIDNDVWFCWTADCTTGNARIETCGMTTVDTKLAVYAAGPADCPPTDADLLACNEDDCGLQSGVEIAVVSGQTYLIRLGTFPSANGGVGEFSIQCFERPANDLCENAVPVAVPSVTPGTTEFAAIDDSFPSPCGGGSITSPGVWYTVVGTGHTMTATTCDAPGSGGSATYDTKISVYCADCVDPICVDGNDDACTGGTSGLLSTVTWCSIEGATYNVLVHGFGGGTGDFELAISDDGMPCSGGVACPLPPDDGCNDCPAGTVALEDAAGNFGGWCVSISDPDAVDIFVDAVNLGADAALIEIFKDFTGPAGVGGLFPAILLDFIQVCPDDATVSMIFIADESVTNQTDSDWTDFHFILFDAGETWFDIDASQGFSIAPFATREYGDVLDANRAKTLTLLNGVVPDESSFFPGIGAGELKIGIDLSGDNPVSFTLKERPTFEPILAARCFSDGSCQDRTEADCNGAGGAYQNDGTDCGTTVCTTALDNDECATCTDITAVPFSDTVDTSLANSNGPPGSCNSGSATIMDNDVWYCYTPTADCALTVSIDYSPIDGTGYDGMTAVYTGPDCDNLTEVDCLDSGFGTSDSDSTAFSATAGTTYWFQVGDWGTASGGGSTTFDVDCVAQSVGNDDCMGCTDITAVPFSDTVDTNLANSNGPPGSCNSGSATIMDNDVWYCYTPTADCALTVSIDYSPIDGTGYDGMTAVYTGPDCDNLTEVDCLDSGFGSSDSDSTAFSATAGTTYWFQVGDWGTASGGGSTTVDVDCVAQSVGNDDCMGCTDITAVPFSDTVDTSLANSNGPPGSCNSGSATIMDNDVWYCYTPTADCALTVSIDYSPIDGTGYDGMTAVYTGPDCDNLTEVDCLDSGFGMSDSDSTSFGASAGTTYWFQVGDWGTASGGGSTTIDVSCP